MTVLPDDGSLPPLPPADLVPPTRPERYGSAVSQIERLYMLFRDYRVPIAARVEYGHMLLALGAQLLPTDEAGTKTKAGVAAFLRKYRPPHIITEFGLSSDHIPTYTVPLDNVVQRREDRKQPFSSDIGAGAARQQAPVGDLDKVMRLVESQQYTDYLNGELILAVAEMIAKLTALGILRREPQKLDLSFRDLTESESEEGEDEEYDDEEQPEEGGEP